MLLWEVLIVFIYVIEIIMIFICISKILLVVMNRIFNSVLNNNSIWFFYLIKSLERVVFEGFGSVVLYFFWFFF